MPVEPLVIFSICDISISVAVVSQHMRVMLPTRDLMKPRPIICYKGATT